MYLTPAEAQAKFGFNRKTLSRWADTGKIDYILSPGGHRRYSLSSVVGDKDRLCRFGFDFIEWYCSQHDCTIEVLDNNKLSPYQELMHDFMSIMQCFSSKLYFLRKYEKKVQADYRESVDSQI